uniref:Uncharacterized protein n=1 Tax=Helianthus annuus TaxID=4232 RepID=A0A251UMG9_HELAN
MSSPILLISSTIASNRPLPVVSSTIINSKKYSLTSIGVDEISKHCKIIDICSL